jgi:hypothetical protein
MSLISCNKHKDGSIFKFGTRFNVFENKFKKFNFSFNHNNDNMLRNQWD